MAQQRLDYPWLAFNRGVVDARTLARVDLRKLQLAAETQTNWMPRRMGSMSLRPGLQYTGATASNNMAKTIPFVFATDDTARIEITDSLLRVWIDDTLITRADVDTAFTNGTFDSDVSSWTDADESGAASGWDDGSTYGETTGGYMTLVGTDSAQAIRRQTLTVAAGDQNVEHGLRVVVTRGPVTLRVGSTSGGDEYITETALGEGTHSLAFTPTGASAYVQLSAIRQYAALVDSIAIESSGTMTLPAPWAEADLWDATGNCLLRVWQSADVVYCAVPDYQQHKIERRGTGRSWSVVTYQPEDGPFRLENTSATTLAPDALNGDITITASANVFRSTHVGALFSITSVGQNVEATVTAENTFTDKIRITGTGATRAFTIIVEDITGTSSTATLQISFDEGSTWSDVSGKTYTSDTTTSYTDGLDNQEAWYRIGVKTDDYSSGTISLTLQAGQGSITGVARITAYTSATSVDAIVLSSMGGTTASEVWSEGEWSDFRGWPTAVAIHEGRLSFAGKSKLQMSVSDAYEDFDPDTEGASGPLNRTIGFGPIDTINWLLPTQRLLMGVQSSIAEVRSSSLDEAITPTNFNIREPVTLSTAPVDPVKIDTRAIFVHGDNKSVFELKFDQIFAFYTPEELTKYAPDILSTACIAMAVQRRPDTRIHMVRDDGTAVVCLYDPDEDLRCLIPVETDGVIEDVTVMPGQPEERVYYTVKRTINSSTVRYHEKFALETETVGGTLNKQADAFATFTNSPAAASIPAGTCSHLVGETVVVWADGLCLTDADGDIATFTVESDGSVAALTDGGASYSATTGIVGLAYTAQFKSAKLAPNGALNMMKAMSHLGLVLRNTHARGLEYGTDFDHLDNLPTVEQGTAVDADSIWTDYGFSPFPVNDDPDPDLRLCLQAKAPRPCTVTGAVIGLEVEQE